MVNLGANFGIGQARGHEAHHFDRTSVEFLNQLTGTKCLCGCGPCRVHRFYQMVRPIDINNLGRRRHLGGGRFDLVAGGGFYPAADDDEINGAGL